MRFKSSPHIRIVHLLQRRVIAFAVLPFLLVQISWVSPFVESKCQCPAGAWCLSCVCKCQTCVKNRSVRLPGAKAQCCTLKFGESTGRKAKPSAAHMAEESTLEKLGCDCDGEVKKAETQLKDFLKKIIPSKTIPYPLARVAANGHALSPALIFLPIERPG